MKKYLRILAALIIISGLTNESFGQKLSKYYSFRNQEGGNLYFILPFEDFKNRVDGSDFAFDITYRAGRDTAIINFSYFTYNPTLADSLRIISGDLLISKNAQKLFVDFEGKKWQQRFTSEMLFSEFESFISSQTTPSIQVLSGKLVLDFEIKEKKWNEYSDAVEKILYIIKAENE